jgi:GMP synthase (glutamine-hydrolysing)
MATNRIRLISILILLCAGSALAQLPLRPSVVLVVNTELDSSRENPTASRLCNQVRGIIPETWSIIERHFLAVDTAMLRREQVRYVLLSGQGTPWSNYPRSQTLDFRGFLENAGVPVLGICGGHQLIAQAFGVRVAPIWGELRDSSYEGLVKQHGFTKIRRCSKSPLFKHLCRTMKVWENHYEEVKSLPRHFKLIATEKGSRIQAIQHKRLPIYGVQFHPEKLDPQYPDGEKMLLNFFGLRKSVR